MMNSESRKRIAEQATPIALAIAGEISLPENFFLICEKDKVDPNGRWYYQIRCWRPDTFTGEMGWGGGRKAYLSPHMVRSELVRLAFGLYLAYVEHEAREGFQWRGRRVFGPHIDVESMWEVAECYEARDDVRQPSDV